MVANCVVVLNEIMADAGGMATNRAIIHHLLGRLEDFNEWGVCHVLALVSRSASTSINQSFAINIGEKRYTIPTHPHLYKAFRFENLMDNI